jgi:hypothetical protein
MCTVFWCENLVKTAIWKIKDDIKPDFKEGSLGLEAENNLQ